MKKRLLALVCTAAMLLCVFPVSAFAAGSLEGVDYSRIHSGKGYGVVFSLGNMDFHGDLSKGSPLTQDEQDRIIKKVMNEMNITSGMLTNAKSIIEAANKIEGFNMNDVKNALLKLTGAETFVDMYNIVMGSGQKTSKQISTDIAKGQILDTAQNGIEDVLTAGGKVALKGAGKFAFKLMFMLPDLAEIGFDSLAKYENIKETVAKALEREMLLDQFYEECNRRIGEESGDDGEWKIRFDGATSTHNFNFWGVGGLMSQWTLTGELVRQVTGAGEDAAGNYEGKLTLEIKALDMAETFDKDWIGRTSEIPQITRIFKVSKTMGYDYTDEALQTTVLERTISGEFNFYLTGKSSGAYQPEIFGSFDGQGTIDFSFSHTANTTGMEISDGKGDMIPRVYGAKMTSTDLNAITLKGFTNDYVGPEDWLMNTGGDIEMSIGTVWQPLESKPVLTINFGK